MHNIYVILLDLEGFRYAKSHDFNMVYYHIQLSENVSNLFTTIFHWGEYCCKRLLMGVAKSQDISNRK